MQVIHRLNETPKERLERVAKTSRPFRRELAGPNYLIAVTLLLLAILMVVVGIVGGTLGAEIVYKYALRLIEWAFASGR